jgi:hypothetical protein
MLHQGMIRAEWHTTAAMLDRPLQVLIGAMLVATVASGLQYLVKAIRLLHGTTPSQTAGIQNRTEQ